MSEHLFGIFLDIYWLCDRYGYHEDYAIPKNIICLTLIMVPLFLVTLNTSGITHGLLVCLFFATRLDYLDNYESTAHDAMHKRVSIKF